MPAQILIVDDDPAQRRLLEAAAIALGLEVVALPDGRAALERLAAPDGGRFDLMILDLVLPELDGIGVLERLPRTRRTLPVIAQVAQGGIDQAASAIRAGATDFLVKPASPERIEVSIRNALRLGALEKELARSRRASGDMLTFDDLVATSPAMARVIQLGLRAAGSPMPILLEGESGTGKERIARAIHGSGDRKSKPFVAVSCGMLAPGLLDATLFGLQTGPSARQPGKLQQAQGGTLFLDGISDLPLDIQTRLLRALQEGEIEPVGAKRPIRIDIRLIAATDRDLIARVKQGLFREDLYYRLNVFPIRVPPLRDRREDIPDLVQQFAARFAGEEGKRSLRGVAPGALDLLTSHPWPGNVRQLENAVFRAVALADGPMLTPADFPQMASRLDPVASAPVAIETDAVIHFDRPRLSDPPPTALAPRPDATIVAVDAGGDVRPLVDIESEMIRLALDRYRGRMATVARKLGIGRSTLYRKLKELGIAETGEKSGAGKIAAE
ncbi:sigma-54 dependent transcriptional regulator [Kaistia defluvii]|uniref:sigma-54-dependent transcriptional regulator n=1 Tax=Kaistia defluvii TaxID=410841 RepID=UPI0022519B98|nr:sigma-54 dependent transcriptional regulator [Kaistia defluvii]MCX5517559.1 sigma-54 dependent transcriptional regulator [Kaistia defluvii]